MKGNFYRIVFIVGLMALALIVIASSDFSTNVSTKNNLKTEDTKLTNIFLKHYNASKIIVRCKLENGKYQIKHVYRGANVLSKVAFSNGDLMRNSSFPLYRGIKTTKNLLFIFYPSQASKRLNVECFAIFDSKIDVGCGEMDIGLLDNPKKVNDFVSKLLKRDRRHKFKR